MDVGKRYHNMRNFIKYMADYFEQKHVVNIWCWINLIDYKSTKSIKININYKKNGSYSWRKRNDFKNTLNK